MGHWLCMPSCLIKKGGGGGGGSGPDPSKPNLYYEMSIIFIRIKNMNICLPKFVQGEGRVLKLW